VHAIHPLPKGWGFLAEMRLRIYNRALNESEIENNHQGNITINGLVSWWMLDEGNGNIARDNTHNHNHGIISGATWKNYAWHSYTVDDTYAVTLTVTDNDGAEDNMIKDISVGVG